MCTAATYKTEDFYFGRTLDYECSYGEEIVIMPRNFRLQFLNMGVCESHYAVIGTAHIAKGYPLFYDAMNEKGLCMAGLNFVGNARYFKDIADKDNVAQYEFIPYILAKCADVNDAKELISKINITDTPFDEQMFRLNDYMHLSRKQPQNNFSDKLELKTYSRGMGAIGLPGDLSSQSRFVRVAFVKANSVSGKGETESVSQFFHILGSVDQQRGCCEVKDGEYEITIYTSCCNADKGIYYYTTYDNHRISAVDMRKENLDGNELISYPMITEEKINYQN